MEKLFRSADKYLEKSDWKDIAVIKFCLCSMGIMIGAALPEKSRKAVILGSAAVFAATYIPLMGKYFGVFKEMLEEDQEDQEKI